MDMKKYNDLNVQIDIEKDTKNSIVFHIEL